MVRNLIDYSEYRYREIILSFGMSLLIIFKKYAWKWQIQPSPMN